MTEKLADRLTATEASRMARMSPDRLLRRLRAGEIEGEQVAGRWLVSASALRDYLERHAAAALDAASTEALP